MFEKMDFQKDSWHIVTQRYRSIEIEMNEQKPIIMSTLIMLRRLNETVCCALTDCAVACACMCVYVWMCVFVSVRTLLPD